MRDYAELIHDLRCCSDVGTCNSCSREKDSNMERCDSIEREAADAIEELLNRDVVPMDFHERCLELEVHKRIEIEKQMPRWISVEERLPEKSKIVLVAYDNGVVAQGMLFFGKFRGANFGFDENDEPIIAEVTHWMPLPAPPKGVE